MKSSFLVTTAKDRAANELSYGVVNGKLHFVSSSINFLISGNMIHAEVDLNYLRKNLSPTNELLVGHHFINLNEAIVGENNQNFSDRKPVIIGSNIVVGEAVAGVFIGNYIHASKSSIVIGQHSSVRHENSVVFGNYTHSERPNEIKFSDSYRSWQLSSNLSSVADHNCNNLVMDENGRIHRYAPLQRFMTNIRDFATDPLFVDYRLNNLHLRSFIDDSGRDNFGLIVEDVETAGLTSLLTYSVDKTTGVRKASGISSMMLTALLIHKLQE